MILPAPSEQQKLWPPYPASQYKRKLFLAHAVLRCPDRTIPVHIRLAVALRILAGGSYLDVAALFGLATATVYDILWDVIDAINDTPAVGTFYFPQDYEACLAHAERFKVW